MRSLRPFACSLIVALLVACGAPGGPYPDDFDGKVRTVGADELRAWEAAGKAFQILDVRTPGEFREDPRAPDAVLQTWSYDGKKRGVNEAFLEEVPRRFASDRTLVLLCSHGMRAAQAAWALQEQAGYSKVYVYGGGYEGHHMAGYPAGDGWIADGLPLAD